ncbi:endoglucanase [Lasiosphaeria ovina]|uniref:Endoglucanase n=1 Tax=Lasiosphaeria ovina TaxID=92902 RepID=A0AAE0NJ97_9PEZI|nr:endoglucanase [Lasiosphaeria ovina]
MKSTLFLVLGTAAALTQAATLGAEIAPRQQRALCDLYAYWSGNGYELLNSLWGKDAATSGSQCTYLHGTANNGVQRRTTYAYVSRQVAKGKKISSIGRMPTSMTWYGGNYELMIWLARYGNVYPIGSSIGSVTVAEKTWDLWTRLNGAMRVYSFVPPSGTIKSFSADVKEFFNYLEKNQQFPSSQQNLIVFQVRTEVFMGAKATFKCTQFTADVV